MPHIPNQPVIGRIKQIMNGNRQLDHTKASAKMATGNRHRINHLGAQFIGNLLHLCRLQRAQVFRSLYRIKERGLGRRAHTDLNFSIFYIASPSKGDALRLVLQAA